LKSFLEKRFHASAWFEWKAVTCECHKFYHACHDWKSCCARYLVDSCHVFQSSASTKISFQWLVLYM